MPPPGTARRERLTTLREYDNNGAGLGAGIPVPGRCSDSNPIRRARYIGKIPLGEDGMDLEKDNFEEDNELSGLEEDDELGGDAAEVEEEELIIGEEEPE